MAQAVRLLLVSDQPAASPLHALAFAHRRCDLVLESDPEHVVAHWAERSPDLIVFDVNLPGPRIAALVSALRQESVIPILLLTSDRTEKFALQAYEAGADECILKPISLHLLEARIKVWCRRVWSIPSDILEPLMVNGIKLSPPNRTLHLPDGTSVPLTHLEMRLMYCLMARPDRVLTFEELGARIWGDEAEGNRAALKNLVYRLRQKLESGPSRISFISTVPGVGYRFASP